MIVLTDFVYQPGNVDEHLALAGVGYDETKTFGFIEEFYYTFLHCCINLYFG